jgi:phosphotransferase system  glucose/maltose/N-acetylglucosamine-specific IIC component
MPLVRVYPINKSLRLIVSALVFILVFPSVKSVIKSLPAFLKP